ncbi:MAG: ATP-binding cassette domain-containing protein [Candidatus Cloacimonadaceae bacterium]|nr:ATP-binding cassette domain-containing protein [Candidatus Cloacimonadaceae bacterium]
MGISLDLTNCSVSFLGGNQIDISIDKQGLSVSSGDIILLLGDNGSGKSSYLKAVSGVYKSTILVKHCTKFSVVNSGTKKDIQPNVSFNGDDNCVRSGYLSQVPRANIICSSIRDEFEFSVRRSNISTKRPNVNYALDQVKSLGITENHSPYQLSKGQQQIVGYLALSVMEPELLFLDEPTAFLDDSRAIWVLNDILEKENRERSITFIATHDQRVVDHLKCDPRVIVLRLSCNVNQVAKVPDIAHYSLKGAKNQHKYTLSLCDVTAQRNKKCFTLPSSELIRGSYLSINGSNGSGKTTLIDAICGFHKSATGSIVWGDNTYKTGRKFFDFFSYITQNAEDQISMYDSFDELRCNGKMQNWPECLADLLIAIKPLLGRFTWSLSYGQRKLLVACAQLCSAPILFMDEPFASLDGTYKSLLKNGIAKFLQSDGIAIIAQCNKEVVQVSGKKVEVQI